MPGNPRSIITEAEGRFAVRVRLRVPGSGFGQRLDLIHRWLDENCGADGWSITPAGTRGIVNDAVSVFFRDATLAAAFVARWCAGAAAITADDGCFDLREDEPTRHGPPAPLHKTP